jgi:hypothetical protein
MFTKCNQWSSRLEQELMDGGSDRRSKFPPESFRKTNPATLVQIWVSQEFAMNRKRFQHRLS